MQNIIHLEVLLCEIFKWILKITNVRVQTSKGIISPIFQGYEKIAIINASIVQTTSTL